MSHRGWRITPDGVFGRRTRTIVLHFQKEKGLTVDGLIGNKTWDAAWNAPTT